MRWLGTATIVTMLAALAEIGAFCFYRMVVVTRAPFLAYVPPHDVTPAEYERYRRIRDDVLGWPMAYDDPRAEQFDSSGARPSPAYPTPGDECISLYGDSLVYASEVADAEAWGNLLSQRTRCRVANFAVGGYGTDQAYLRFRGNERDHARVTLLGLYLDDAIRNVNQYRFLITGAREEVYGFKPRFVLEDGHLKLVPLPTLAYRDLEPFFTDPARFLEHEEFLPDSTDGPVLFRFPYVVSLARMLAKERARRWISGEPSGMGFLEPGHPTGSMELTVAIAAAFQDLCQQRKRACAVVVIPTPSAYHYFLRTGQLVTEQIDNAFEQRGLHVLDLTRPLADATGRGRLCPLLSQPAGCRGHFNPAGNRMISEITYAYLVRENLLP